MDVIKEKRRSHLLKHIKLSGRGLEIGPYSRPTVTKDESEIYYLDFKTREQLTRECADIENIDKIPETDYIVSTNAYEENISDKFDYIIANHVIEHVPNPIMWLNMLRGMLNNHGILFLAIPDKKHTFDRYRDDTPVSHILFDYYSGVTDISHEHALEIHVYYDNEFVGKEQNMDIILNSNNIMATMSSPPHIGIHCHVFQCETFLRKILFPLMKIGLIHYELIEFVPTNENYGGEFYVILKKCSELEYIYITPEDFYFHYPIINNHDQKTKKLDTTSPTESNSIFKKMYKKFLHF